MSAVGELSSATVDLGFTTFEYLPAIGALFRSLS